MKHFNAIILMIAGVLTAGTAISQNSWPKNIQSGDDGKLTVYEPQYESLTGDQVTGRAAVAIRKSSDEEPVFGAILFNSTIQDGSGGNAAFSSMRVTNAKFPGIEGEAEIDRLTALVEKAAPGWNLGMSKNQIADVVKKENTFNNTAPKIIYADKPTTLVVLAGEPKVLYDENLKAEKVANSPNIIFKEGSQWNLYAGGNWYKSSAVTNGWKPNTNLSAKLETVNQEIKKQEAENNKDNKETTDPRLTDIKVVTEPTELLQTDGEPVYKNVSGTSLLYVSNSPNQIFKDINSQKSYILIAGRWYSSPAMSGPWTYVPSNKLPADFAKIPDGSDKSEVLANVAGTDEAEEAIMDAEIPQTAKVDRRTAKIDVQYDGEPVFNRIQGTSLQLAENANVTVMIDASGNYFALDNGVWFISDDAYGPWAVANARPQDVEDIPASSPAYNTRYVYVYDYTPDYVYTGYTSGYLGSYIYGPTIIYGTGYWYRPWFRRHYFPRPITWGFGFYYDPWYGWNINFGYNFNYLYVGYNYGHYPWGYGGGWFGPSRYCPVYYGSPYHYGGYYYARNNYPRRNDYYVRNGGSRPARYNVNIYNNQQGVVTTTPSRPQNAQRSYRPNIERSNANTAEINRERYNNVNNANRNRIEERPVRQYNNDNREAIDRSGNIRRREQQPTINNNNNNSGSRPQIEQRPSINNRPQQRSEAPVIRERSAERIRERQSAPIQQRPSAPVQRQSPPPAQRQFAPVQQRPAISNRPSVTPRSENSGSNNRAPVGRRPFRD